MSRPELTGHASLFYNEKEARKYHSSSRMVNVQREITLRAIELLLLPTSSSTTTTTNSDQQQQHQQTNTRSCFILDVGCGSGLSGQVLEEQGHVWVGCDVSRDMLQVAKERMDDSMEETTHTKKDKKMEEDEDEDKDSDEEDSQDDDDDDDDDDDGVPSTGDLMHHDMGTGLPFRPGTFDACISISALQWLCYSNTTAQSPKRRLMRFFSSLYAVLKKSARAVLQFYPETAEQAVLISECATAVGFGGGIVVDYPNSAKAKKHYLVLSCDRGAKRQLPQGLTGEPTTASKAKHVNVTGAASNNKKKQIPIRKKKGIKTKEWIVHKKETQRQKGKNVRPDSKYTARRRNGKF